MYITNYVEQLTSVRNTNC